MNNTLHPTHIVFGVTNQCTAACINCSGSFTQNPEQLQFLSAKQMIARIDEAFTLGWRLPSGIGFTGGEALIQKADVLQTAQYARSKGLTTVSIMSNGSWARNVEKARETALELKEAGITEMYLSTGCDHQQFTPEQSIINACQVCQEIGLYCDIDVESEIDDTIVTRLAKNPKLKQVKIREQNWIAWKTGEPRIQGKMKHLNPFSGGGCDSLWTTCYVDHSNNVRPCCGQFNNSMHRLVLGSKLEDWYTRDPLQKWLAVDSPYVLYSLCKNQNIYPWHECQACIIIQNNPKYFDALASAWPQHRDSVIHRFDFIKSLFIASQKAKNENN